MQLLLIILYFTAVFFVASIPVDLLVFWLDKKFRDIDSQLEISRSLIRLSKAGILFLFIQISNFAKGFFAGYLTQKLFDNNFLVLSAILLVVIVNNWSCYLKFKNRKQFLLVLWGAYTFIYPPLFLVFPIGYVVMSLIFNSLLIGSMVNIIFMFFPIWYFHLELSFFSLNLFIFMVYFISVARRVFSHFEDEPYTILKSFNNR
jgi:glycerol-3-phosphate acyltransferase PlsY